MHGLMVASPATPSPCRSISRMERQSSSRIVDSGQPPCVGRQGGLAVLIETWPGHRCRRAEHRRPRACGAFLSETPVDAARGTMMSDLFTCVTQGRRSSHPAVALHQPSSDAPRAHALARHQAELGQVVVNAHHEMHKLEPLGLEVLGWPPANGASAISSASSWNDSSAAPSGWRTTASRSPHRTPHARFCRISWTGRWPVSRGAQCWLDSCVGWRANR